MLNLNLLEIIKEILLDFITFGILKKTDREGKVLKKEDVEKIAKFIGPHLFGLGQNDEAIFNATLSKLQHGRNVLISKFLNGLSAHDRKRFIYTVTLLPDEKDRLNILNMYSFLPLKEMRLVAKSSRMITGGPGPLDEMSKKAKEIAKDVKDILAEKIWPMLKNVWSGLEKLNQNAEALGDAINQHVQNPGWFGRLANKLVK